jgi:hypothetical protein
MTWSPDSSTTGGAQTGVTSPTFTLATDTPPAINATKKVVTAYSGAGLTVSTNTASKPFDETFFKPAVLRALPAANPITGSRGQIPNNQYKLVIRKGGLAEAGVPCTMVIRVTLDVPAGMETYNPDEVRAAISFLVGLLNEESADLSETILTGTL